MKESDEWKFIRDARIYVNRGNIDHTFADLVDGYKKSLIPAEIVIPIEKQKKHSTFYYRAATANSLAKKLGVPGRLTESDYMDFFLSKGQCEACGSRDHNVFARKVAFDDGGTNTVDNLRLLCRVCNMKRTVKDKR